MGIYFFFNVLSNIITNFFQNGIWVVGFFFLFEKVVKDARMNRLSVYVMGGALFVLLVNAILNSL